MQITKGIKMSQLKVQNNTLSLSKSPTHKRSRCVEPLIYVLVPLSLFLFLAFQNCNQNINSGGLTNKKGGSTHPSTPASSDRGNMIAYLPNEGEDMAKTNFLLNSNVHLKLEHADPRSDNFKWTIKRGFDTLVDSQPTSHPEYSHLFALKGSYDISATSYQGESVLTQFSKKLFIGEQCDSLEFLEPLLQEGSLTAGGSATFGLKNTLSFNDIHWKVTLPSEKIENHPNSNTVAIDLINESVGTLILEVSAVISEDDQCLTYRKKTLQVSQLPKPYLNPITISHQGDRLPIKLEDNDIYRYTRPQGASPSLSFNIDIQNADQCEFYIDDNNPSSLSCVNGVVEVDVPPTCTKNTITLTASAENSESFKRIYYNYCMEGDCYFGPQDQKPNHHVCSESVELASEGENPKYIIDPEISSAVNGVCDNSQQNGCSSGTANDNVIADTTEFFRWHCVGIDGGNTATDCQKAKPVNGVCDNSQQNGCSSGTANDNAIADTTEFFRWHCVGIDGGNTATDCQKARPVNGVCDNSQQNSCSSGTANDNAIADTTEFFRWHCVGIDGGNTATDCQKARPVNGVCDNSQQNSCSSGTANDNAIADTTEFFRWHCVGIDGGNTATDCQKAKPVNGVCDNSQQNGCSSGTANDNAIADTTEFFRWHCVGIDGGNTATDCQKARPVNGVCDNSQQNGCSSGTANDNVIADTTEFFRWHCVGIDGGNTATDCQKARPVNGVCDNSQQNGCSSGTANDNVIADTTEFFRWRCDGLNEGGNSDTCQKARPRVITVTPPSTTLPPVQPARQAVDGVCSSTHYRCSSGRSINNRSGTSQWTWQCQGSNRGRTVNCDEDKPRPVHGVCSSTHYRCSSGRSINNRSGTSQWTWQCQGSNRGRTVNCDEDKPRPVHGVCSSTHYRCSSGRSINNRSGTSQWTWQCQGSNRGRTVNCDEDKPRPVHGVCSSTHYRCSSGRSINNRSGTSQWTWQCQGSNRGRTVNCDEDKPRPVHGVCSSTHYRCSSGRSINNRSGTSQWTWQCQGSNRGRTVNCDEDKPRPVHGVCSSTHYRCSSGRSINNRSGTSQWTWQCQGSNRGRTVNCDEDKPRPVHGVCSSTHYRCSSGRSINNRSGTSQWTWQCQGSNRGRTVNCDEDKPRPVHGVCSSTHYRCSSGRSINNRSGTSQWTWQCRGSNGGRTVPCSKDKPRPVHGVCSSTHYRCSSGRSINNRSGTSQWTWQCRGSNGGRTVPCSKDKPRPAVDGVCGGTCDDCISGELSGGGNFDQRGGDIVSCQWRCLGSNGGRHAQCDMGNSGGEDSRPPRTRTPPPTLRCNPPHSVLRNGRCVKSCGAARGTHSGNDCRDTRNYNINIIRNVYDVDLCCTRVRKPTSSGCREGEISNCRICRNGSWRSCHGMSACVHMGLPRSCG